MFKEVVEKATSSTVLTTPPEIVTKSDLQEVIEGWKIKFQKLTEGVRAIQIATEEVHPHMDNLMRDNCASNDVQERRIKKMQEGLARFLERCNPAHPTPVHPFATPCAPTMSITPSGVPSRHRPDFHFASPVNQSVPTESTRGNGGHDFSQRPTHEDEHGNSGDTQHPPINNNSSGMNNSASKVTDIRRHSVRAISTMDYTIRSHCAPPMLDLGRESCTTGSFPDRPSSEHANRYDHGTTG